MDNDTELRELNDWIGDNNKPSMQEIASVAEASLLVSAKRMADASRAAETRLRSVEPSMRRAEPNAAFKAGPRSPEYRSAWIHRLRGDATEAQRDALRYGEVRDLTHGTGSSGAYTVPQDFGDAVAQSISWNGAMRSVAKIVETPGSSRTMPLPTTDSSSAGAATILTENTAPNEATDPVFAAVTLHGYPFVAPAVLYPFSLVQDTAYTPMPQGVKVFGPVWWPTVRGVSEVLTSWRCSPRSVASDLPSAKSHTSPPGRAPDNRRVPSPPRRT